MSQKNPASLSASLSLTKPVLIGAGIALVLISLFLLKAGDTDPSWPKFWMIRPLIIVPLAGAVGGGLFYFMHQLSRSGYLNRTVVTLLSFFIYIVGLWLGTILGLDGTMWN